MTDRVDERLASDVRGLLKEWVAATCDRDADAYANLFLRDPDPLVVWPNGALTRSWRELFEHVRSELYHSKSVVREVDVVDLHAVALTDDTAHAVFHYDVHAIDLWGTSRTIRRLATLTLARTKDGLRVASAHFGAPPPAPAPSA